MGGVIFINGVEYGMSAQHARFETNQDLEEDESDHETPCFDDDSDYEENDLTEITSEGSISSSDSNEEDFTSSTSTVTSQTTSMFNTPRISRARAMISPTPAQPAGPLALASRQCKDVSNLLSERVETDLDYEIFPLGSPYV
ncbi:hypothetical protein N7G274_007284 [Stereocaulon virgatum]|uniref:Uncharacterized protein n=1 Tax=Stereocaulon virgatum TaxID=373712 RepID=A0ABR4A3I1_9LECA